MKMVCGRLIPSRAEELLEPARRPVFLLIDVQNDFAHEDGHFARAGADLTLIRQRLPGMKNCLAMMRGAGMPVIHIHQSTLPDGKSDSDAWLHFKTRSGREPDYCLPESWGAAALEDFTPGEGEPVITKFRPDAFFGTALDTVLAAGRHQTVVVAGLFTEGCVESTVRAASCRDHYVIVAEDAVASAVPARHDASLALMGERYTLLPGETIAQYYRNGRDTAPPTDI